MRYFVVLIFAFSFLSSSAQDLFSLAKSSSIDELQEVVNDRDFKQVYNDLRVLAIDEDDLLSLMKSHYLGQVNVNEAMLISTLFEVAQKVSALEKAIENTSKYYQLVQGDDILLESVTLTPGGQVTEVDGRYVIDANGLLFIESKRLTGKFVKGETSEWFGSVDLDGKSFDEVYLKKK